jgi:hypothetical protein
MRTGRTLTSIAAIFCLNASALLAQDAFEPSEATVPEPETPESNLAEKASLKFSLEIFGEHAFERDMGDGGTVSSTREGVRFSFADRVGDRGRLTLSFSAEGVQYDFNDIPRLFNGDSGGESDLYAIRFAPVYFHEIDELWGWLLGGALQLTGGKDALTEDALAGGFFIAGRKQINQNFALALGVSMFTRLEDDPVVVPYIGIDWRINDRVTLASNALGIELSAQLEDDLVLNVFGQFDTLEYRLADDSSIPDGVLQENLVNVGLGLDWTPKPEWTVGVQAGIRAFDRFKTQESNGDDFSADTADPTWFIGASLRFRF